MGRTAVGPICPWPRLTNRFRCSQALTQLGLNLVNIRVSVIVFRKKIVKDNDPVEFQLGVVHRAWTIWLILWASALYRETESVAKLAMEWFMIALPHQHHHKPCTKHTRACTVHAESSQTNLCHWFLAFLQMLLARILTVCPLLQMKTRVCWAHDDALHFCSSIHENLPPMQYFLHYNLLESCCKMLVAISSEQSSSICLQLQPTIFSWTWW